MRERGTSTRRSAVPRRDARIPRAHACRPRLSGFWTFTLLTALFCLRPSILIAQTFEEPPPQASGPPSDLVVRPFGSVQWRASDEPGAPNSFAVGQFALFATSAITDRISLLAEMVMEGGTDTRVVTDLERLLVTFHFNDHFQVSAGRYHTGIGFYNTAFHHATYFETVIERPRVFAFEDEGGVLPVHDVGVTVRGTVPNTGASLYYLAEIGNGRSWSANAEEGRDENDAKATNVGLSYRPEGWRGFEVGVSFYRDAIPQPASLAIAHRIAATYVVYRTPSLELMTEWLRLTHNASDTRRYRNDAGYVQASKSWGRLRPYYRYDRLALDPATPFLGATGSFTSHTFGVRLDPVEQVALKLQYERTQEAGRRGIDTVRTQLAFVF